MLRNYKVIVILVKTFKKKKYSKKSQTISQNGMLSVCVVTMVAILKGIK